MSGLVRVRDWESRLDGYFRETARRPFKWGETDCALWACGGIAAETGVDPSWPFRAPGGAATYDGALGAGKAMKSFAGGGLDAVAGKLAHEYGAPEVAPAYARRGDLVIFAGYLGPTLGLVALDGVHVYAAGPEGRAKFRLRGLAGAQAWQIG